MSGGPRPTLRCSCSGRHLTEAFVYDAPPAGEVRFDLPTAQYARAYDRCSLCGHWFGRHAIDLAALYERGYVDATYGGPAGMRARLEQVLALPPERSDNAGRVERIQSQLEAEPPAERTLLDVGSGLGVFPARMAERTKRSRYCSRGRVSHSASPASPASR